jgi:uncharacterized protein
MTNVRQHRSHPEIAKRLKRAAGHLNSILTMLDEKRGCLEIAQQLHAVEAAIAKAKKALIHDHLDHCLDLTVGDLSRKAREPIDEFKEITKYL